MHDPYDFSLFLFYLIFPLFWNFSNVQLKFWFVILKAEEAARESRQTKQDRYAEMRRRKDEEREAKERQLVSLSS